MTITRMKYNNIIIIYRSKWTSYNRTSIVFVRFLILLNGVGFSEIFINTNKYYN